MNKQLTVLVVYLFSFSSITVIPSVAELPRITHDLTDPDHFTFLVVGDWGRRGQYRQSHVAHQMEAAARLVGVQFIVATGDDFYDFGLDDENDPAFEESFTNVYNKERLNMTWYVVLGNHDYYGTSHALLSLTLKEKDSRWICHRAFVVTAGKVDFFLVDTPPMVEADFQAEGYGIWSGELPNRATYNADLINALDSALENSTARWKIVVGHHTIASEGFHGPTEDVVRLLEPTLLKHNVDFYFNGHDHCLQITRKPSLNGRPNNIRYVTSGGGSSAWVKPFATVPPGQDESEFFYYGGEGFVLAEVIKRNNEDLFVLAFYDVDGNRIHTSKTFK